MEEIYGSLVNYGWIGIAIAAISEGIFLPLPMETISVPIYLFNTNNALMLSITLVIFSIIGSIIGYHIGKGFGSNLLNKFLPKNTIEKFEKAYEKNAFIALATAAFTPVAYEAYVLSAGTFKVSFKKFIYATIISRIIRHIPLGVSIWLYGELILGYIKKYFIIATVIICSILVMKLIYSRFKKENSIA